MILLEVHRIGKFPSDRTTGQDCFKPDTGRTGHYPKLISVDKQFSELGNEYDEKRSRRLLKNSEKIFYFFFKINFCRKFLTVVET